MENTIERAINVCEGEKITHKDLPKGIFKAVDTNNDFAGKAVKSAEDYKIESLEELEMRQILKVMKLTDGNISRSAAVLKTSRNTIYNKIKKYDINRA